MYLLVPLVEQVNMKFHHCCQLYFHFGMKECFNDRDIMHCRAAVTFGIF